MTEVEYAQAIITPLLSVPEALKIDKKVDEMGVLLSITADRQDMGKIIGSKGETAKSIRNLMRVFGNTINSRISIKINEPHAEGVR